jgi:hypothetical protein
MGMSQRMWPVNSKAMAAKSSPRMIQAAIAFIHFPNFAFVILRL